MKLIELFAILFFDIIDKFFHQKKILLSLRKKIIKIESFIDVGSHKGTYTDLIIKNFQVSKVLMFEPQKNIFKIIKKKYKGIKSIKIFNNAISNKKMLKQIYINRHDLTSSLTKIDETKIDVEVNKGLETIHVLLLLLFFVLLFGLFIVISRRKAGERNQTLRSFVSENELNPGSKSPTNSQEKVSVDEGLDITDDNDSEVNTEISKSKKNYLPIADDD